jgi:hypothetical protein
VDLFNDRSELAGAGPVTLDQLADHYSLIALDHRAQWNPLYRELDVQTYRIDFEKHTIDLVGTRGTVTVDALLVALVADGTDAWRWAWDAPAELNESVRQRAEHLRSAGQALGIQEMVTPEGDVPFEVQDKLLRVCGSLSGKYVLVQTGASLNAEGVYLVSAPELDPPPPTTFRIRSLLHTAREQDLMDDHMQAVMGYVTHHSIPTSVEPDGRSLRLRPDGGDLLVSFDADRRITNVTTEVLERPSSPAGRSPARTLDDLVNRSVLAGEEYQEHFERVCRDLGLTRFEVHDGDGVATLVGPGGSLDARATLVALLGGGMTWHWVWTADVGHSGNVKLRADALRQLCEETGVPELVTPVVPLESNPLHRLQHAVRSLLGQGGFLSTGAIGDMVGCWLFAAPELVPPEPGLVRVSQLLTKARKQHWMTNHREAVASYVAARDIATTEDPDGAWTRLHLHSGSLTITFDSHDEIVDLKAGAK